MNKKNKYLLFLFSLFLLVGLGINSANASLTLGALTIDSSGVLNLGTSSATSVNIAKSGVNTIFNGNITIPTPFTLGSTLVTTTGAQFNYLNATTGTTGTTSSNLVLSDSPTFSGPITHNITGNVSTSTASTTNGGINYFGDYATSGQFFISNGALQLRGGVNLNPTLRLTTIGTGYNNYIALDRSRGTFDAPVAIQSGDIFGTVLGTGFDGVTASGLTHASQLSFYAAENWDNTHHGAGIELKTIDTASTSLVLALDMVGQKASFFKSTHTVTKGLEVQVATGYNFRAWSSGGADLRLDGANDAGSGFVPMRINSSLLYLNDILGGNVAISTADMDGTPAIGRLTIKGSTNNGSTNILVGRNSDETNVFSVDTNGGITIGQLKLSALNTAPATSSEACVTGEVRVDASYVYVCTSTNAWKRSALTTW